MKHIYLFTLLFPLFYSLNAHAQFTGWSLELDYETPSGDACKNDLPTENFNNCIAEAIEQANFYCDATVSNLSPNPAYKVGPVVGTYSAHPSYTSSSCQVYSATDPTNYVLPEADGEAYNVPLTDEQCQSQYGTATVPATPDGFFPEPFDAGACSLSYVSGTGYCSLVTMECTGDFIATSTGENNTTGGSSAVSDPETPEYLTETTDPDSCPAGSVSYGGASYCVDQSAIDEGLVNIIDTGGGDTGGDSGTDDGGIDWGDTPSNSTPGTSTGPDGDPLGMGEGDPDGDGEGDSTLGDVVAAINGLKDTVRNGFDGIYEKTVDFVEQLSKGPSQASLDAEFGTEEEIKAAMQKGVEEVTGELTSLIDGSGSEFTDAYDTMGSYFSTYFPTIPEPSCSPLVFAAGEPYSFTIDCEVFDLIREALAWILYAFTVYVIISTMFSARPH